MEYSLVVGCAISSFLLGIACIRALISVAPGLGLVDHPEPEGRKSHLYPTPLVGGIGIFLASMVLLVVQWFRADDAIWIWLSLFFLLLVGVADDRVELPYRERFFAHLIAGLLMALLGGVVLYNLGDLLGTGAIAVGYMAIPLTMFAVASSVNALNLIDGVDGLASGLALIPLALMTGLAAYAGLESQTLIGVTFISACLAFMLFNFPFSNSRKAHCFLGDTGSNLLGFVIVWLMIDLSQLGVIYPITALYILSFPLMDTAAVILRRRARGVSPTEPGRDHIHHVLLDSGFSRRATVLIIQGATLLFAMLGVMQVLLGVPEPVAFWIYVASLLGYLLLTRHPDAVSRQLTMAEK